MHKPATLSVFYQNHFDLVWRRCWKRRYEYLGLTYRSYADLQEAIITRSLKLAVEQGAALQLEQTLSLREYLRRHPDTLPVFQQLSREGRFALLGSGEAILDTNLCNGETLARNLASGIRFARDTLGQTMRIAYHGDGFGSSAQFPQIARLCELRGIDGLSYLTPDAPYWRGLDGATVLVHFEKPGRTYWHDHCYYEPCLECRGHGCNACEDTGLRLSQGVLPHTDWADDVEESQGRYLVHSEEMLPDQRLPSLIVERNALGCEQYVWRTEVALLPLWQEALDAVDDPKLSVASRVENNPIHSGTLVSRIRIKQAAREAEGWFYAAEKLASLARLNGGDSLQHALEPAWLNLPVLFFHDAVTGTHNDPASQELLDIAQETVSISKDVALRAMKDVRRPKKSRHAKWPKSDAADLVAIFNPHSFMASLPVEIPSDGESCIVSNLEGHAVPVYRQPSDSDVSSRDHAQSAIGPSHWQKRGLPAPRVLRFLASDIPPLSVKVFRVQSAAKTKETALKDKVELGSYRLAWDEHGVRSIFDSSLGKELLDPTKGPVGHLILETDVGDPWGTRDSNRPRTSCAAMSRLVAARQSRDAAEVVFEGTLDNGRFGQEKDACVFGLQWRQTVRLLRGLPWVEFDIEVFWQSVNRRIRVAFPSCSVTDRGVYKIPYGVLRRDRYEMTGADLWSPNGDWPATYFAATEPHGDAPGIAVINTGTPSVRIEDGKLMYSVLRSPGSGHCLTRYAQEYPMPISEMRDGGHHRFRFALMPYTGSNLARVLEAGDALNHPTPAFQVGEEAHAWTSGITVNEDGVFVAALKESFDGQRVVLRLVEQLGEAREVIVTLPKTVKEVRTANLLEEPEATLAVRNGAVRVAVKPYAIRTLVLSSHTHEKS